MNDSPKKNSVLTEFCIIVIAVLFIPSIAGAFGSWNNETTARELCFLYTLSNDWQQTLDIAENPDKYSEQNPILGSHPNTNSVHLYFATCAATHAFVAYILPPELEKIWQVTWIGIQSNVTEKNNNNGLDQDMNIAYTIKFSFRF